MKIQETDLPGVGKKFELELPDREQIIVIAHNTGKRELYHRTKADADGELLLSLSDQQARNLGVILEGAYFQPTSGDDISTQLPGGTVLEWSTLTENSELVGRSVPTLCEEIDLKVVLIRRESELITGDPPEVELAQGDMVVVAGERENCDQFDRQASGQE